MGTENKRETQALGKPSLILTVGLIKLRVEFGTALRICFASSAPSLQRGEEKQDDNKGEWGMQ